MSAWCSRSPPPPPPHSLFWHIIITFSSISSRTDNFILQWIHRELRRYKLIYLTYNAMLSHTTGILTSFSYESSTVYNNVLWQIFFFFCLSLHSVFWDEINILNACVLIIKLNVHICSREWMELSLIIWNIFKMQ